MLFKVAILICLQYLQTCTGLCSCALLGSTDDEEEDEEEDVRMCCCVEPLCMPLSPSSLGSHPSSIDHVAHYKSTVSGATLQVP